MNEEPAFPQTIDDMNAMVSVSVLKGLTKRECFAAMALQGLLNYHHHAGEKQFKDDLSKTAFEYADAMITQSKEGK